MMQIRTINGAVRQLRAEDPDTAITAALLRRLCRDGSLPYMMDGNRMLVAMDDIKNILLPANGNSSD